MTERVKVAVEGGPGSGEALVLTAPISFWGGIDPKTGAIIDVRHPECGGSIAGKVLFIPASVGSSTASTILLELVYCGKAPAAIVMHEPDAILLLGLIAAREIGLTIPTAAILDRTEHCKFSGKRVTVDPGGYVEVLSGP